jgi:cobalt-zinc-cadmium efflux system protein
MALTVHVLVRGGYPGDAYTADLASPLHECFGIDHATVQIETDVGTNCPLKPAHVI